MKRFAFITPAFTDSTMPLIKSFLKHGNAVDMYFLSKGKLDIYPAFNGASQTNDKLITKVEEETYNNIKNYMGSGFRAFAIRLNRPYKTVPILKTISGGIRQLLLRMAICSINKKEYDGVYILSLYQDMDTITISKHIKANKIIGLHEVCNHSNPDFKHTPTLIKYLSKNEIPIVVYSSKSKEDIIKYKDVDSKLVHETRFGKYETFPMFAGHSNIKLEGEYFLFMGNIKPYKGVDLYIEAAKKLIARNSKCKFVIAGNGNDASVENIKKDKYFFVLNRFISNEELVDLISGCKAIICPYRTASQSGIIQSAYAFNKPVITSDLDSFKECVIDGKTGALCDISDLSNILVAMEKMLFDKEYYNSLCENISNIDDLLPNYSWNKIFNDYQFFWEK